MTRIIDLNADVGEGQGDDAALLRLVTSASIACGCHAGDAGTMHRTLLAAKATGASAGAHPGFDDRDGFGRREMAMSERDIEALVTRQIAALIEIAAGVNMTLGHVKPHGALYNMAARDPGYAMAIGRAIGGTGPHLVYVGQANSEMEHAALRLGLPFAREAFPDRGYDEDGMLLPRGSAGSVLTDPAVVAARAVRMATDGAVVTTSGNMFALGIDTLCIHGDTPGAVEIARAIRAVLEAAGIAIAPLSAARSP